MSQIIHTIAYEIIIFSRNIREGASSHSQPYQWLGRTEDGEGSQF